MNALSSTQYSGHLFSRQSYLLCTHIESRGTDVFSVYSRGTVVFSVYSSVTVVFSVYSRGTVVFTVYSRGTVEFYPDTDRPVGYLSSRSHGP